MEPKRVHANGIDFAYLEQGEGPLMLVLHGFPDSAHTWSNQMPALADAGFRVVAPFNRGYAPTGPGAFYDIPTLATDVHALIRALGEPQAFVVGHDWGAAITYALCAAYPESVQRAAVLAIPHPRTLAQLILMPEQVQRAFHWWFFQLPDIPEAAITANDFAFLDYLWDRWTGPNYDDPKHVQSVKRMFAEPGVLVAALSYYRALFSPALADPDLADVRERTQQDIRVPTLAIFGGLDPRVAFAAAQKKFFTGEYRHEVVDGTEHFVHREQPEQTTRLLLDWFAPS